MAMHEVASLALIGPLHVRAGSWPWHWVRSTHTSSSDSHHIDQLASFKQITLHHRAVAESR